MTEKKRLGLLGDNLGRSRAKNLHELLGELYGIDVSYEPKDLKNSPHPVSIKEELERYRQQGYHGTNVTHPYKRDAFPAVTTVPSFPSGLTSINTVLFQEETMLADNTDYSGFCRAFRDKFGQDSPPGRVLMLGTGGVGVAISYAMQTLGAEELVVADTNTSLAETLVEQMREGSLPVRLAGSDLKLEMEQADGLVNATPLGMFQYPGCAFPKDGLKSQKWAFDAVYTPENTEFLDSCRRHDIETLSGFKLFLFQGLDALCPFFWYSSGCRRSRTDIPGTLPSRVIKVRTDPGVNHRLEKKHRKKRMIQESTINVYEALKDDIVMGRFTPGSKLKMEMLKERYGMGVNVIRESLARLATEDLVDSENQKGFRVAQTSETRLGDLTRLRILLETDGVRHSLKNGTLDWETSLVAAYHKLEYIEQKMQEDADAHLKIWHQCDLEFHSALISACGSELHIHYHRRIFDQYRQFVMVDLKTHGFRGQNLIDEHKEILDAALRRDYEACRSALKSHLSYYLNRSEASGVNSVG